MSGNLQRLLVNASHRMRAKWKRFCEYGLLGESDARGFALLKAWLSPHQLAQYEARQAFRSHRLPQRKANRLRHGTAMNVYELDPAGRPVAGWCFVPKENLVAGDVMLAQKIALETDEWTALAVAKSFPPKWHVG